MIQYKIYKKTFLFKKICRLKTNNVIKSIESDV